MIVIINEIIWQTVIKRINWLFGDMSPYPIVVCVTNVKYNASRNDNSVCDVLKLKLSFVPSDQYIIVNKNINITDITIYLIFLCFFRYNNKCSILIFILFNQYIIVNRNININDIARYLVFLFFSKDNNKWNISRKIKIKINISAFSNSYYHTRKK